MPPLAAPAKGPSSTATRTFVRHTESTHRTTRERTRTSPEPLRRPARRGRPTSAPGHRAPE
ncbi:hypothetical protein C4B68_35885 [Streptomyces dengpaensis]|uniref:Uncharacterized protein n=1 Tax=Streptomyces dengpaensis TaxID=2049881 RepID=A0ABN5IAS5_9ACTN|nr:hypothetical protein C4B68_35885 [Streptomyces dengpaensis]